MSDTGDLIALTTRPVRFADDGTPHPDDVAAAVAVISACDIAAIGELDSGPADIGGMLLVPTMDREASFLVLEGDEVIGVAWFENDVKGRDTFIDVFCPPGPRAREVHDLGLTRGLDAARRHHAAVPDGAGWTARSGCWLADTAYAEALAAHGFTASRTFFRMRIPSSSPQIPARMPALPDGVEIVVSDDEATRRRVLAVDNDSFSEHYNFTERDYDDWWAYWQARPGRDPDGWWLLTVDGDDAAICLLDESRAEIDDGYVAVLGVRKPYRGRGLAQLLLQRAFVHYRELGRAGTQLGVDAENTTGAVRVYERVGMTADRAIKGYSRPIP